jgi:hypothetical protein
MSTIDLIVLGQSNCFQTDTRTGPAGTLSQPDVPTFDVVLLGVGTDMAPKARGWQPLDSRYASFTYAASRQWCGIPEFMVRRLVDVYAHSPRLFRFACGASSIYADWPTTYLLTSRAQKYLAAALASKRYAGTPSRRIIVTIQGESDTLTDAAADAYEASFGTWMTAIRTTLGDADTHVLCMQLNTNQSIGVANGISRVRTAAATWCTGQGPTKATAYDPSALNGISADSIHYSQAGALAQGNALADLVDGLL